MNTPTSQDTPPTYWTDYWQERGKMDAPDLIKMQRTINGVPMPMENIVSDVIKRCYGDVLELGCGTGVLTQEIAKKAKSVLAVDSSEAMLSFEETDTIRKCHADVRNLTLTTKFDTIIAYSFPHYLTHAEFVAMLMKCKDWLDQGGLLFIGDLPDAGKLWEFHNTPERVNDYFSHLSTPKLGTWFDREWVKRACQYAGFDVQIMNQPDNLPMKEYRFDAECHHRRSA